MKPPARPTRPPAVPASAPEPPGARLEAKVAGGDRSVRAAMVKRLQSMVEKHPDQFVSGVRRLLAGKE